MTGLNEQQPAFVTSLSAMPPGSTTEPWTDPLTAEDHAHIDEMQRHRDQARVSG